MFVFRGNSRAFRCSGMFFNAVFIIKLVFLLFLAVQLLPCSFFVVILVLFGVLPHPAQEVTSIFRANSRTFSVFWHIWPKN